MEEDKKPKNKDLVVHKLLRAIAAELRLQYAYSISAHPLKEPEHGALLAIVDPKSKAKLSAILHQVTSNWAQTSGQSKWQLSVSSSNVPGKYKFRQMAEIDFGNPGSVAFINDIILSGIRTSMSGEVIGGK